MYILIVYWNKAYYYTLGFLVLCFNLVSSLRVRIGSCGLSTLGSFLPRGWNTKRDMLKSFLDSLISSSADFAWVRRLITRISRFLCRGGPEPKLKIRRVNYIILLWNSLLSCPSVSEITPNWVDWKLVVSLIGIMLRKDQRFAWCRP